MDEFLVYCRVRRQWSPRTVNNYYGYPLRAILLPFCAERGVESIEGLTPELVDALTMALEGRQTRHGTPLALATRLAYLKALKGFLQWAAEQGGPDTSRRVGLPKQRRIHREVLSRQEIQSLEDAAHNERDKLLVRLMADTGAREGEIAAIRLTDLVERDRRWHFVRLVGKTGERMCPISPELFRRLRSYASGRTGRPKAATDLLFVGDRRRNRGDYEALTTAGVYHAVKDAAARAELGKRIYPHLLRHSAITLMVASGMNHVTVSEICGVSVGVIAQHYAHQSDAQRWEAMSAMWQRNP